MSKIETIRIIAHAPQTARRLAWRFDASQFNIASYDFTQALSDTTLPNDHHLLIVDLGWSAPELDQSLKFLFQITRLAAPAPPKVVALVPRMTGSSRPQWAELGVTLALDRTTPPPEIAERVLRILRMPTLLSD